MRIDDAELRTSLAQRDRAGDTDGDGRELGTERVDEATVTPAGERDGEDTVVVLGEKSRA